MVATSAGINGSLLPRWHQGFSRLAFARDIHSFVFSARVRPMFEAAAKERMAEGGKEAGRGRPKGCGPKETQPNLPT
jgi:hypothetical protein